MKKCIFLDRDGTINVEKNYLYKIEDFEFEKNVKKGLKKLQDLGYLLIIVTNQSGIARGFYTEEDLKKLNHYIKMELKKESIDILEFYYCPHHKEKGIGKYKIECECRKPKSGMLEKAISDYNIDRNSSFMIGDNISDLLAGKNAGVRGILVKTGYGSKNIQKATEKGFEICDTILDFAIKLEKNEIKS